MKYFYSVILIFACIFPQIQVEAQIIPPQDALDSSFFEFVPSVDYGDVIQKDGTSSFTTNFEPAGGFWGQECNEEDVYLARLNHTAGVDDSWDLRIGKGGQIYSFIGPYGEGVPPSYSNHGFNSSRWNDEVWQPVSVSSYYNNSDVFPNTDTNLITDNIKSMKYFIHGAGTYINDKIQDGTFYSPLMASFYDETDRSYYVTNWGQQAHVPSLYKSGLLYTTKYKDIGEGILEVTYIIQNFGKDVQNHLNMPWGGVRSSNLRGQFISLPDNSLEISTANTATGAGLMDIDDTGGYFIFASDTLSETSPSLGLVFGNEVRKNDFTENNLSRIYFRYAQVGSDANLRDYSLFVVIPKIEVKPGDVFYYRFYYVNGNRTYVHEKSQELVPFTDYGFIEADPEETPLVPVLSTDLDNALTQDISLFTSPVKDMVPIFLMKDTASGITYISPDLYHNVETLPFINPYSPEDNKFSTYQDRVVYRNYSGNIEYKRLMGYGVTSRNFAPNIRFQLLDSMIVDSTRVVLTEGYQGKIWIPMGFCDSCSAGLDPEPVLPGYELYSDFGENRVYKVQDTVNMDYQHSIANPDKSDENPSELTGKVVRKTGLWSNFFFEVPGTIDLSDHGTFRIKIFYDSEEALTNQPSFRMILRNNGATSTQLGKWQYIDVANKWVEYSFDFHRDNPADEYNQVWLFFSSPDNDNVAAGQTFYIDQLIGPEVLIEEEKYNVLFSIKDLNDSPLKDISVKVGQEEKLSNENGEASFNLVEGEYDYTISHPDYFPSESTIMVSSDTSFHIILEANKASIEFKVSADDQPLDEVSIELDGVVQYTDETGIVIFEGLTRHEAYIWTAVKEGFTDTTGTLTLTNDTLVNLDMQILLDVEDIGHYGLSLYPNPVRTTFTIESETLIERIDIYDLRGKLLSSKVINKQSATFDISAYPDGIYMASIHRDGKRILKLKLIKSE